MKNNRASEYELPTDFFEGMKNKRKRMRYLGRYKHDKEGKIIGNLNDKELHDKVCEILLQTEENEKEDKDEGNEKKT